MQLVKMRSYWSKVGPQSNTTGVLTRRERERDWQKHGQREHHGMRERSPGARPHSRGMPRTAGSSRRSRSLGDRKGTSAAAPAEQASAWPRPHLDLGSLSSRTEERIEPPGGENFARQPEDTNIIASFLLWEAGQGRKTTDGLV